MAYFPWLSGRPECLGNYAQHSRCQTSLRGTYIVQGTAAVATLFLSSACSIFTMPHLIAESWVRAVGDSPLPCLHA